MFRYTKPNRKSTTVLNPTIFTEPKMLFSSLKFMMLRRVDYIPRLRLVIQTSHMSKQQMSKQDCLEAHKMWDLECFLYIFPHNFSLTFAGKLITQNEKSDASTFTTTRLCYMIRNFSVKTFQASPLAI